MPVEAARRKKQRAQTERCSTGHAAIFHSRIQQTRLVPDYPDVCRSNSAAILRSRPAASRITLAIFFFVTGFTCLSTKAESFAISRSSERPASSNFIRSSLVLILFNRTVLRQTKSEATGVD